MPLDSLSLVRVFPCVSSPSCWQLFLCLCQPGGGPGSAQHSRAEHTGLHPHGSTDLFSDTTLGRLLGRLPNRGVLLHWQIQFIKILLPQVQRQQTNMDWTKHWTTKRGNSSWLQNARDLPTTATGESKIIPVNWDFLILDIEVMYVFNIIHVLIYNLKFYPLKLVAVRLHLKGKHQCNRTRTLLSTLPMAEISWRQQKGEPYLSDVRLHCLYLAATAYPCDPLHMGQHFRPIQCTTQLMSQCRCIRKESF